MKNKSKFIKELVIMLIIASLLSSTVVILLAFLLMNLNASEKTIMYVNTIGASVWGLFVGYKLNTLLRDNR
jgi:hypothetical protein